ncbi:TatD family hydrolase [Candidatus Microgenomates bacterium]|nr:TatD family hydrolase [Candidatus Microgenomates bacterium]
MVDVHCHLNFNAFKDDYDEVIKRAFEVGVTKIINVGLAKHKKVVAIGEIGMDYFRYKSNEIVDPKLQKEVFIKQIELAHRLKKPLQIHNRHAGKDIIDILLNHKSYLLNPPGMFHCMSGDLAFLKKVLELGFYVGFDGNITYKGLAPGEDTALEDLVRATPLDRIVLETDSPYLSPMPFRGQRNEPKNVIIVGKFISEIKGVSAELVEQQTTQNTQFLFNL